MWTTDIESTKNEVIIESLSKLNQVVSDKKADVTKQLMDLLKDDATRLKAFLTLNQLKSAYLVSVRMNSIEAVQTVAEEAKRTKQMTVKNICDRWLLQKSKQK